MAEKTEDGAVGWMERLFGLLAVETDRIAGLLPQAKLEATDVAGLDRQARAIVNLARAARAVAGLTAVGTRSRAGEAVEEMDEDHSDADDPAELERLRAELQSRLDRLRATIERKRLDDGAVTTSAARGDKGDAGPAPSPGAA